MKKLLMFAMILSLLLSTLTLPAMAEGEDGGTTDSVDNYTALTHSLERPEEFENAEFFDFYWYDDGVGLHENNFSTADGLTTFEYVYLKAYEGEDKATAFPPEEAYIRVLFEVETPGVYDFLIEVMAYATDIPRTGLVQVNDGPKYYVSSIHGENHETQEYFSGLSSYLYAGENSITVYLGPDFDDATVKSLFFDNFYFMIDEDAEIPDQAPPMWDENKHVVAHQSFDELRKNGDGNDGVFTPGGSAAWNMTAAVDTTVERLDYWGWVALKGELGAFGYQIDNTAPVYDESFAVEAEEPVVDAATDAGGTSASRMLIGVDVSELMGEHTVRVLYKDSADNVVTLNVFTVNRTAAETETVADDTDAETVAGETTPDTADDETTADTTADTTAGSIADTTADTKAPTDDETGGCASSVAALSTVVGAVLAAFALRRREE